MLAAARRLDVAEQLLSELKETENRLTSGELALPEVRRQIFNLIGSVEMAIVSLGRALAMVTDAPVGVRTSIAVPTSIVNATDAVTAIRNAIEHIEDRAFGTVHGRPHADALDIFDHETLLRTDSIVYGQHRLELSIQAPALLADARGFLKEVAHRA